MADPAPFIDPYLGIYRPVPALGPGVCAVCHSGPGNGQQICQSCLITMDQVSMPTRHVVPISLYRTPGELWRVLRHYKDGAPTGRAAFTLHLAAVLATFTAHHEGCLSAVLGGRPDFITTVPSTRIQGRPGRHPLESAVRAVTGLGRRHLPLLQPGPATIEHGQADDHVFAVTRPLRGERVLVIDDTFTTGARAQSAASALYRGGASRVALLAIGRAIWPDWNEDCRRIWDRSCSAEFTFNRCCLCRGL